ncbi:MAG: hypothetical protein KJO08_03645, partial [Gammaproteobacteria bacterium]|nr:hypothetical protein [Gammaproteobacteria bacterium]
MSSAATKLLQAITSGADLDEILNQLMVRVGQDISAQGLGEAQFDALKKNFLANLMDSLTEGARIDEALIDGALRVAVAEARVAAESMRAVASGPSSSDASRNDLLVSLATGELTDDLLMQVADTFGEQMLSEFMHMLGESLSAGGSLDEAVLLANRVSSVVQDRVVAGRKAAAENPLLAAMSSGEGLDGAVAGLMDTNPTDLTPEQMLAQLQTLMETTGDPSAKTAAESAGTVSTTSATETGSATTTDSAGTDASAVSTGVSDAQNETGQTSGTNQATADSATEQLLVALASGEGEALSSISADGDAASALGEALSQGMAPAAAVQQANQMASIVSSTTNSVQVASPAGVLGQALASGDGIKATLGEMAEETLGESLAQGTPITQAVQGAQATAKAQQSATASQGSGNDLLSALAGDQGVEQILDALVADATEGMPPEQTEQVAGAMETAMGEMLAQGMAPGAVVQNASAAATTQVAMASQVSQGQAASQGLLGALASDQGIEKTLNALSGNATGEMSGQQAASAMAAFEAELAAELAAGQAPASALQSAQSALAVVAAAMENIAHPAPISVAASDETPGGNVAVDGTTEVSANEPSSSQPASVSESIGPTFELAAETETGGSPYIDAIVGSTAIGSSLLSNEQLTTDSDAPAESDDDEPPPLFPAIWSAGDNSAHFDAIYYSDTTLTINGFANVSNTFLIQEQGNTGLVEIIHNDTTTFTADGMTTVAINGGNEADMITFGDLTNTDITNNTLIVNAGGGNDT